MKQVKIYKLQDDGAQAEIATCRLVGNEVICEGNMDFINYISSGGITDYSKENDGKLYPADGEKFLKQLKHNFSSGYYNASDILEVN